MESSEQPNVELPPPGDYKMPSMAEVLSMIDTMEMDEDQKEQLRQSILKGGPGVGGAGAAVEAGSTFRLELILLLIMVSMLLSALFFFGYKLFKSLRDRELKREEKRRQKQLRKKK